MSTPRPNRLVLIPDRRPAQGRPGLRRYRLARLDLRAAAPDSGDRFGHIKRVYD